MPQLIISSKNDYPRVYDLGEGSFFSIGRSKDNDILVTETSVSAHHANLTQKEGLYRLEDLGSSNGTTVNGKPVKNAILKDGYKIKLGSVRALFVDRPIGSESESDLGDLAKLKQEAPALKRQSEIERNNLKLLEQDTRQIKVVMDKSLGTKRELEEELEELVHQVDTAKADLTQNREESEKLAGLISEARAFEAKSDELESEFKNRQSACDELSGKIMAGEKLYAELDLENSIKQKEKLEKDLEALSKKIEKSRVELEENTKASKEAVSIFEEAKMIEAGIGELEGKLESRKKDCEELEKKIADHEKANKELGIAISDGEAKREDLKSRIEGKEKKVAELSGKVEKNEGLIRSAGERLADVEKSIQKGLEEVSQSKESQKSLEKESLALTRIVSDKSTVLQRLKERIALRGTAESDCPPLRLINPEMSSLVHYFHHGAGSPDGERYDPVGYHAFAACTRGSMHRDGDSILSGEDPVLVLLSGEPEKDRELIDSISGRIPDGLLLACWREGQLTAGKGLKPSQLPGGVSGVVSTDPGTAKIFGNLDKCPPHLNVPIPCPVEFPEWDLSGPVSKRGPGIFLSGDNFDPDSPLHRARVELLNRIVDGTGTAVTLYQQEPGDIAGLKIPGKRLETTNGPLKYSEYLRLLGTHRLVMGFGKSFAGSDVSGDAVLGRAVFCGADSGNAVDELLFPDSCITGDVIDGPLENANQLLSDDSAYLETMERSQGLALQLISFEAVRDRINDFIHSISGSPENR